jgi:hypothetical protein
MKIGVMFVLQMYESMVKVQLKLDFLYFQMDKALICINVFLKNSYHNHSLLKFSYKSMLEILKIN